MANNLEPIVERNLSIAWANGFLQLMNEPNGRQSPFVISIQNPEGGNFLEVDGIRQLLDGELRSQGCSTCHTVANTIFPWSMWNPKLGPQALYDRYDAAWPRIKRVRNNWRGVYFQRLINFDEAEPRVNQLRHIISTWQCGNHRQSALQGAVFDPRRDHNDARQLGFPCLHQVAFSPQGTNGVNGLAVTGFYATQTMFEKTYGNLLGLSRLGRFMSQQMGLELVGVTCIAALEILSQKSSKKKLADLSHRLAALTPDPHHIQGALP